MHTAFCSIRLCHVVTDLSFREMVVVHPDNEFLEDITDKLEEVSLFPILKLWNCFAVINQTHSFLFKFFLIFGSSLVDADDIYFIPCSMSWRKSMLRLSLHVMTP
jgi:hypothetical protein